MINLGGWHSVQTFEALVAHGWQVHVCLFLSDFDSLELSVVEVVGILYVLHFGWISLVLQISEVGFGELRLLLSHILCHGRVVESCVEVSVDGFGCCASKVLSIQVFTLNLGHETSVAWYVLGFKSIGWACNPSFSFS